MLEQYVRQYYQHYFVDHLAVMVGKKMTPLQITMLGGLVGCMVPVAIYYRQPLFAVFLLLMSGLLDTLDGTVARIKNQVSDMGSLLDIFIDRLVEFSVIFGIWVYAHFDRSLMCLLMLGSIF